ncbi:MAG: hypothetical protein HPZ91_05020 [Lentisphaeria bacterium]|nr:hypothetical protein [Lentisphaeria bacterium]
MRIEPSLLKRCCGIALAVLAFPAVLCASGWESPVLPVSELTPAAVGEFTFAASPRRSIPLPERWKLSPLKAGKELPASADADWRLAAFDDSGWQDQPVPLCWFRNHPEIRKDGNAVRGFYRVRPELPELRNGERALLSVAQAGTGLTLYVNGKRAGEHAGNFTPGFFDLTDFLGGGPDVLGFEVTSSINERPRRHAAGCAWGVQDYKGGIWGKVSLDIVPGVHIRRSFITPHPEDGSVEVRCEIVNTGAAAVSRTLAAVVRSAMKNNQSHPADGVTKAVTLAPGVNTVSFRIALSDPVLWEPENPHLYYLQSALFDRGRQTDLQTERFGLRSFKVDGKRFLLNGNQVWLFGGNLLSVNYGGLGRDDRARLISELSRLRDEGYNILRTPHQPIISEALELADEFGMMIFDEWAWAFSAPLDESVFAENSLREVREWVRRDYNHPSVVMWSCGNEVFIRGRQHDYMRRLFVALVRQIRGDDASGRPVSVMDGCDDYYGTAGLETDLFSFHQYAGLSQQPWSMVREVVNAQRMKSEARLGRKLDKPVILFECVGYSWNAPHKLFTDKPIPAARYRELAARRWNWGAPGAGGGIGATGMRLWLHPDFEMKQARNHIGKHILETFRLMPDEIQGFSPWFMEQGAENARLWNAPLQSVLSDYTVNVIAGNPVTAALTVMNDQHRAVGPVEVELELFRLDAPPPHHARFIAPGSRPVMKTVLKSGPLDGFARDVRRIELPTGAELPSGDYRLNLRTRSVRADGKAVEALNYYSVFIQNPAELGNIPGAAEVGIPPGFEAGAAQLRKALEAFGVPHRVIRNGRELKQVRVLIVPPGDRAEPLPLSTPELIGFLRDGGRIAILEQSGSIPVPGRLKSALYVDYPNAFVDPVEPGHPLFAGLHGQLFDGWDGGRHRLVNRYAIPEFGRSTIVAAGVRFEHRGVRSAVTEERLGKGTLLLSQLDAFSRFGSDSVATRYCRNLIAYLTAMEPYGDLPELGPSGASVVELPDVEPLSLAACANRTLADFIGKGDSNLRTLPTGEITLGGVPFSIPASGKAAIVVGGNFSRAVRNIRVGRKVSALAFLHGADSPRPGTNGSYLIRYADGRQLEIPLVNGINIGNWWNPADLPDAPVCFRKQQQTTDVAGETLWTLGGEAGLYLFVWHNPRESTVIESIDFRAAGSSTLFVAGLSTAPPRGSRSFTPAAAPGIHPANGDRKVCPTADSLAVYPGVSGFRCRIPAPADLTSGMLFLHFGPERSRLTESKPKRFAFLVRNRSRSGITLKVTWPELNWRGDKNLSRTLYIEPGEGFRRIEFRLDEELAARKIGHSDLRPELCIGNGSASDIEFDIGAFEYF